MRKVHCNFKHQKGAAILTALFIMTIIATVATALLYRQHLDIRRTNLILTTDQSYQYAHGVFLWAKDTLTVGAINSSEQQALDVLPIKMPVKQIKPYTISGEITDAQAFFNINNLKDVILSSEIEEEPSAEDAINENENKDLETQLSEPAQLFKNLLIHLDPTLNDETATQIVMNISHWLSTEGTFDYQENTRLNDFYLKQNPPYRASHRLMSDISELQLVQGIDQALYYKLQPHITALPTTSKINIHTIDPVVLMTIDPDITQQEAEALLTQDSQSTEQRDSANSIEEDSSIDTLSVENLLTDSSEYYFVTATVKTKQQTLRMRALLHAASEQNEIVTDTSTDETSSNDADNHLDEANTDDLDTQDQNPSSEVNILWQSIVY